MPNNPLHEIIRFQVERDLHLKKYVPLNEHTNIVEELLESLGMNVPKENRQPLQEKWAEFVHDCINKGIAVSINDFKVRLKNEEVDAYVDIIVFAIGAIMKLGYNPELALQEGAKEINSRIGTMVNGKFEKDLSDEAKALWYKADYDKCKLN